jgi:hypothetical protein
MKKCIPLLFAPLLLCLVLASCSAKLFVIRPTLIDRITIENLSSGESTELIRGEVDEVKWLMDDLVLQMAEFYKRDGKCAEEDGHLYEAAFYNGDRLELSVFINEDGSVCKNKGHYVLSEEDAEMVEEDLENWVKAFELGE